MSKKSIIIIIFLVLSVIVAHISNAAVINVTTTKDNKPGSLRAAISEANTNGEDNTIYLHSDTYFLSGAARDDTNESGDLDIDTDHALTIIGTGKTLTNINGNGVDRVLHILNGAVSLCDLTILDGHAPDGTWTYMVGEDGGGINNHGNLTLTRCLIIANMAGNGVTTANYGGNAGTGGGIYNIGKLFLKNCTIKDNRGGSGGMDVDCQYFNGDGGKGGGIYNTGTQVIDHCTISRNCAGEGLTAISKMCRNDEISGDGGDGGGIYNEGDQTITHSTIDSNKSGRTHFSTWSNSKSGNGGGICIMKGTSVISNCIISRNETGYGSRLNRVGEGGGIYNNGNLTMSGCTVSDNITGSPSASWGGYGGGISNSSSLSLLNCTISGNQSHGNGGGLYNSGCSELNSVTLVNNATRGGRGEKNGGGIYNGGIVYLKNSIIANNKVAYNGLGKDCFGNFDWVQCCLIKDIGQCVFSGFKQGNILGKDPMIGTLMNNGGFTKTHALLPGSPAIDAGDCCGLETDQRGFPRPIDIGQYINLFDGADIGAYETSRNCTISGKVIYTGYGLPGVALTFSGRNNTSVTDMDGYYTYVLPINWTGTVTPAKPGYTFSPSSRSYNDLSFDQTDQDYTAAPTVPTQIALNRTRLNFGAISSEHQSAPQTFTISNSGGGILNWNVGVGATEGWLSCTPSSGTGSATITVSIDPSGLTPGAYTGTITIADPNAVNSPQTVKVKLTVYETGSVHPPFGGFDTPVTGSTVTGSIPVTGWAIDNIGFESVKIYRNSTADGSSELVYIGDVIFVEGARPDIETIYPEYPNGYKAGWGYLLLTNALPDQGNGTFTLYAKAEDKEGNTVTLGSKNITCDNINAVKPFGAIDTPAPGGAVSGKNYANFGWTLTPLPNTIPTNGSTITVWMDGVSLGHPAYNENRPDVAALFPTYNNSAGAGGHFLLNTSNYPNGVHTIAWTVSDNGGNADGIGSRYFTIQNTGNQGAGKKGRAEARKSGRAEKDESCRGEPACSPVSDRYSPVRVKKGFNADIEANEMYPDEEGVTHIEIRELERVEIHFSPGVVNISTLPIGSTLDVGRGIFYWQPGPGFIGDYEFIFLSRERNGETVKTSIAVKINPKSQRGGKDHE